MKKVRKLPQGRYEVAALAAYNRRNKVLRDLGFGSYEEYLASPLWAEISRRKLDSEGRRCYACGKTATQVHHGDYEVDTMLGVEFRCPHCGSEASGGGLLFCCKNALCMWRTMGEGWYIEHPEDEPFRSVIYTPLPLYVVCRADHEWSEYYLGAKLPPEVATKRLKNRRKKNRLDEPVPRVARQGRQELRAREMSEELARLLERDEK